MAVHPPIDPNTHIDDVLIEGMKERVDISFHKHKKKFWTGNFTHYFEDDTFDGLIQQLKKHVQEINQLDWMPIIQLHIENYKSSDPCRIALSKFWIAEYNGELIAVKDDIEPRYRAQEHHKFIWMENLSQLPHVRHWAKDQCDVYLAYNDETWDTINAYNDAITNWKEFLAKQIVKPDEIIPNISNLTKTLNNIMGVKTKNVKRNKSNNR